MGIYKRAHVRGMAHELTRQGIVTWPSKLAEEEAADAIADATDDEEIPEVSGEEGLSPEQAQEVINTIVEVAQDIADKTNNEADIGVNKESANMTYEQAASVAAIGLMQKAAEETSVAKGPMVPGSTVAAPDLGATAEAEIDAVKVPSSERVGPRGTSDIDTKPGAVGQEAPTATQPGAEGSPPTGEVAKLSSLLQQLSSWDNKMASDGASLSGGAVKGPTPSPRQDLDDNLVIPGAVADGRGQSAQKVPASAYVGQTSKNPAGTPGVTAETNNEPAKDALKQAAEILASTPQGREYLAKLSQAVGQQEAQKQAEAKQVKEAAVAKALQVLAAAVR